VNAPNKVKAATVEDALNELDRTPHVYQAIADVQGELSRTGIAKAHKNSQGSGYMFRGIDDVYAALSPLLAKHRLVMIPRIVQREVIERQSKSGGALFYVSVHAEFDFVSAIDGTTHTAATFGEAMDSGDKATNKAMSAAYKYAAFMTFAIPTEGDNDADASTHEVAGYVTPEQLAELQAKADEVGADVQRFCNYFGIASLKEVPSGKFDAAMKALAAKAKQKQPETVQ
jgi:hypothetical protein